MTVDPLGDQPLEDEDAVDLLGVRQRRGRARRRRALWFAHSSGRFDRSTSAWRASLRRLRGKASVVTGTEAAGRTHRDFQAALEDYGWDYVHLAGAAVGECYASWDAAVLELFARPFARKLTDLTWNRSPEYGGGQAAKVHGLVVPLRLRAGRRHRRYVLVVVHWPLDNTTQRAEVWRDVCRGLVDLVRDLEQRWPEAELVLVGDVNKNLREPRELAAVHRSLVKPAGLVPSWHDTPASGKGTHGSQVIDMAFARPGVIVGCELLEDDASSDHRPFRYRLRGGWRRRVA